jgi:RNA polymerase Rpb2, domain 5
MRCTTLQSTALYYPILPQPILSYPTPHYPTPFLHYPAPHQTTLHYTVLTVLSRTGGALKLTPEHIQGLSTGEASRSLESLIAGGVIEYVDVNEENNCLVALDESDITKGTALLFSSDCYISMLFIHFIFYD